MDKKACFNCEGTMYLAAGGWVCLACDTFEPVGEAVELQKRAFDDYKIQCDELLSEIKKACTLSNPEIVISLAARLEKLQRQREGDILRLNELESLSRREAKKAL